MSDIYHDIIDAIRDHEHSNLWDGAVFVSENDYIDLLGDENVEQDPNLGGIGGASVGGYTVFGDYNTDDGSPRVLPEELKDYPTDPDVSVQERPPESHLEELISATSIRQKTVNFRTSSMVSQIAYFWVEVRQMTYEFEYEVILEKDLVVPDLKSLVDVTAREIDRDSFDDEWDVTIEDGTWTITQTYEPGTKFSRYKISRMVPFGYSSDAERAFELDAADHLSNVAGTEESQPVMGYYYMLQEGEMGPADVVQEGDPLPILDVDWDERRVPYRCGTKTEEYGGVYMQVLGMGGA